MKKSLFFILLGINISSLYGYDITISGSQTTTQTLTTANPSPHSAELSNGSSVTINSGSATGITTSETGWTLDNFGTITTGGTGSAISFTQGGIINNKQNTSTISTTGAADALVISAAAGTVTNSGTISSSQQNAINMSAGGSVINNANSTITGAQNGVLINGAAGNVNNSGIIQGGNNSNNVSAIQFNLGGIVTNNIGGQITGQANGVTISGGVGTISNTGTIIGTTGSGINLSSGGTVTNTGGSITGATNGVMIGGGTGTPVNSITNSATITGTANDGILLSNGGIVVNNAGGVISGGTNGIEITNAAGTISNAGTINGGTLAINFNNLGSNSLILNTGSVLNGNVNGISGTNILTLQGTGSENSVFTGFSNLTMNGTSWALSGASSFGSLTMTAGSLSLVGPTISGNATINGGALNMIGTITGNLISNGGSFSPGSGVNSIGTMSIGSPLTLGSGGNMVIDFQSAGGGPIDLLNVTGTAPLNGSITINPIDKPLPGFSNTFLTASSVTGTFSNINISPLINASITTSGTTATLTVNSINTFSQVSSEKEIAAGIDANYLTATGELYAAIVALYQVYSVDALNSALASLSPEPFTDLPLISIQDTHRFMESALKRMSYLRTLYKSRRNNLPLLVSIEPMDYVFYNALEESINQSPHCNYWKGYAEIDGDYTHLESQEGHSGLKAYSFGVRGGIDRYLNENLLIGVNLGGAYSNIHWDAPAKGEFVSGHVGGYIGLTFDRFYLDNEIAAGFKYFNNKRFMQFASFDQTAHSKHFSRVAAGSSEFGFGIDFCRISFVPIGGLDFILLFDDSYKETGAGNAGLEIADEKTQSLKTKLGLKLAFIANELKYPIIIETEGLWRYELLDDQTILAVNFIDTDFVFNIHGPKLSRNSALVGTKASCFLSEDISTYLNYQALIANRYYSHTLSAGLNYTF